MAICPGSGELVEVGVDVVEVEYRDVVVARVVEKALEARGGVASRDEVAIQPGRSRWPSRGDSKSGE